MQGSEAVLASRLQSRGGHFFAPALLSSQLQTLQPPDLQEEDIIVADIEESPGAGALYCMAAHSSAHVWQMTSWRLRCASLNEVKNNFATIKVPN